MPDPARHKDITVNRRAFFEYHIDEKYEAGLALVGSEVKSLREGRVQLKDSYARFVGDELYLVGAHINVYGPASQFGHEPERQRKLLLHRHEIDKLTSKIKERGLTLIPLRMYWVNGRAKVELGLARGKKLHDKRESIRERSDKRDADRAMSAGRKGR
jgi:SsrA-binding protein